MTPPAADEPRPRADARRNRDRILDAAALTLSQNADASLADIADAAGLSRATAYRHFPDVDAVRAALTEEASQVGRAFIQEHLVPLFSEGGRGLKIDDLADILRVALPLEHRWTTAISSEPIPDEGLIKTFTPMARALLKRGQQDGEFRADIDADVVGESIIALSLFAVRKVHAENMPVERALDILRPYLDGLRPREVAAPRTRG